MANQRSREELLNFLDYVATKGLMSPVTARSRKASANRVLGILSEDEAEDVTVLDIDALMQRFSNLEGKNYTPESMMTYKSRVKAAIDDFRAYLSNPLTFKPRTQARPIREPKANASTADAPTPRLRIRPAPTPRPVEAPLAASNVLNIPLRSDLTVRVHGLPFDLSPGEAKKIANVILAMAAPAE
jgi:hypothetical protein